jgi:hypothetical protein
LSKGNYSDKHSTIRILGKTLLIISILCFLFSLTQECYCTDNGCGGEWSGLAILFSGTFGFFLCPAALTWLANPAIFLSWVFLGKKIKVSLFASGIAVCLSIAFLFFHQVITNEGGTLSQILNYKTGYWLWVLSMIIMFINTAMLYFFDRNPLKYGSVTI